MAIVWQYTVIDLLMTVLDDYTRHGKAPSDKEALAQDPLNEAGALGWELVAVVARPGQGPKALAFLKRPIPASTSN